MMPRQENGSDFSSFNPMRDDYNNSDFNRYASGPGENLDQQMSRGPNNSSKNYKKNPFLVFRNMPKEMSLKALRNLCQQYGKVLSVRDSTKNDHYFVDLETVADMEAVYRGLENNSYGFQVQVGKVFDKPAENKMPIPEISPNARPRLSEIDMESRTYRASSKQHPRVKVNNKKLVSPKDYMKNPLLRQNDPKQHFLIEDDAHHLERDANLKPNMNVYQNKKYNYSLGQANIPMPDNIKEYIDMKHQQSKGEFHKTTNTFSYENSCSQRPLKVGNCIQCKRMCDVICSRCSAYLCSLECQRLAWPEHRYICGKPRSIIDTLKNIVITKPSNVLSTVQSPKNLQQKTPVVAESPSVKPSSRQGELPHNGTLITLTSVSKTNIVFIRSKTYEDNLSFFKTIDQVNAIGKTLPPLETPPKCGQIVVTQFEGQFKRAMVLNSDNPDRIRLVYIDYGSVDRKPCEELREAPRYFIDLPRYAIPVVLKDVPDCFMTDEIRKFMYSYLDSIDLQLKYKKEDIINQKGVYSVELFDDSTGQSFNKTIVALSKAELPVDSEERYFREYLKQEVLPSGKNVELVIMDNSLLMTGCISCSTKPFVIAMQKFQNELQQYAEKLEENDGYAPSVDELCIVKYDVDQNWYRGRCLELVGDGYPTVVFFDYGNIAIVNIKNIRPYPAQFSFPIMTSDCEIDGLPEQCNNELVERLEQLIPIGSTIMCDEVKVFEEDKFHSLSMPRLINQLKSEELLN